MIHTDADIQRDIVEEMKWEASLHDDDIAVAVRDGVVTLAGYVNSYFDRYRAERIVERLAGVKAVVNNIEVRLPTSSQRPDPEIARAAVDALKWNVSVPADRIKVKVDKGWVTLEGDVDWNYQREAAERAVRSLTGVRGVSNLVTIRVQPAPSNVKQRIIDALKRGAEFDASRITVEVDGHRAILRGKVRSYAEMKDAERAARNAPGITEVDDELTIDPNVYAGV